MVSHIETWDSKWLWGVKFMYSEKATKFCEISTLLLSTVHTDKSKVEILQNFVAFSEYIWTLKRQKTVRTQNQKYIQISISKYFQSKKMWFIFCRRQTIFFYDICGRINFIFFKMTDGVMSQHALTYLLKLCNWCTFRSPKKKAKKKGGLCLT